MLVPPIAKPKARSAASPTRRQANRTAVAQTPYRDPVAPIGIEESLPDRAGDRPRATRTAWDFGSIPIDPTAPPSQTLAQPRLAIGRPDDLLEREAERVADRLQPSRSHRAEPGGPRFDPKVAPSRHSAPLPQLSRGPATGATSAPTADHAPAIVHDVLRTPGRPLDASARAFFEPRFSHDFSRVRIHTDTAAAQSAHAVKASAYTVGNHLVFAPERYAPHAPHGRRLLAHELTHVIQQGAAPAPTLQREPEGEGIRDAGAPPIAGVPEPTAIEKLHDDEIGWEYKMALDNHDGDRVTALEDEMDRRFPDWGTAVPRGPEPVVQGGGAVTPDVGLNLLDNMSRGEFPFKPEQGLGGASWFTTEGAPYTSVNANKSVTVRVEIAKGSNPLIFREADLARILEEEREPTRQIAEREFREKFKIPEELPLSKGNLKKIARTLDRFNEKRMWEKVGQKVAASAEKAGEVILEPGSRFSDSPGKFAVIAEARKVTLKGGTAPLVESLAKEGAGAEPVIIEAAEEMAKRLKWVGRVRTCFTFGGRVLIVVAVAADLYKIYRAENKVKAIVTTAGGWAGAWAAGTAFAAWYTPADAAGPWAWVGHGVGTLVAGGVGYWIGSRTVRYVYELILE